MQAFTDNLDPRELEGLYAFWRDAGVEFAVEDEAIDRTLPPPKAEVRTLPLRVLEQAPAAPDTAAALAEARRLAKEAESLDALQAAISAFEGCPLRFEGARQAVFARGQANARVMVIGEAPSDDEDAQGAPFVGRAGKLLDKMLAAAGLLDDVFITNTVYWRPPGNRPPSPQEQAVCAPFLEKTITLVKPRILLLVGATSAKALLKRSEGILSLRGKWFEWRAEDAGETIPALPTLHPAFLLRQPQAKKKAWSDLLSLSERLDRLPT